MDNQSFDLLIECNNDQWRVKASCELVGEAESNIEPSFTTNEWQNTFAGIVRSTREIHKKSFKEKSKDLEKEIKTFGSDLFKAVFTDKIRRHFDKALAKSDNSELHITLRLNAPELNGLPWECLYDAEEQGFITLSEKTPVLRYLEVGQPVQSLEVKPPLQVLVVISAPKDLSSLDVEKEWEQLQAAVGDLERRSLLELTRLETPTLQELHDELSLKGKQYHILHFIGHGDFDKRFARRCASF